MQVVIDGKEQTLTIVRQDRIHGQEAYWDCPAGCGKLRWHLYIRDGVVGCRECLGLSYAYHTTRNKAALRARKLRRKLGAAPGLLSALPTRPKHWRRDYWSRALAQLAQAEGELASKLRAMVGRRRKRTWPMR